MSSWNAFRCCLFAAAIAVAGAAGPSLAQDAAAAKNEVSANCKVARTSVSTGSSIIWNQRPAYEDIEDATITVKLKKRGCLVVRFTADASSVAEGAMYVRAVLDGKKLIAPGEVVLTSNDGQFYRTHSMEFVVPRTGAGSHTIKMQWHAADPNKPVSLAARTVSVWYQ